MEEFSSGGAGAGHLGATAIHERTEVIDQDDRSAGIHAMMMPDTVMIRHPDLPPTGRVQLGQSRHLPWPSTGSVGIRNCRK
ncbi:hypothetical protein ACFP2T_28405 [Plantactinospora solaniradicis]|uniref:Uncharacterized protein n=1 Tax=Plantactinospora solaniradicis TaxID=1723736 RepID=A0ABW1KGW1_9ACTN